MSSTKHPSEWKIYLAKKYLLGEGSCDFLAEANGISGETLRRWVLRYQEHGEAGFFCGTGNKHYSKELKEECVKAVLSGEGSVNDIAAKYNISSDSVLWRWIMHYNANKELKDYDPKREVYMADARRKTTLEERKEIVGYCITHNKDYKGTAALYNVSYSQVYSWVRKYLSEGEESLVDKRGHHKTDAEVDEMERLRRENLRLKRQLEERDMVVELLKKVKELEGM